MDFTLMLSAQPTEMQLAAKRGEILATNQESYSMYGIQLTAEDAAMILQTGKRAMDSENLIEFGSSITPRIIHWFLPAGYFGTNYAGQVAALTEAFYHIKGSLQALYDEANDPECVLSDNALLDYMYRLFISPTCAGDIDLMTTQAERILCGGMQRLLTLRAQQKKQAQTEQGGDPVFRALYADRLQEDMQISDLEQREEDETYDYTYRAMMHTDCFGNYEDDYDEEIAAHTRGTYAEELEEALLRNPALLLPSAAQEEEWDRMTEAWEEADAAGEEL